jgi:hypothetical protein
LAGSALGVALSARSEVRNERVIFAALLDTGPFVSMEEVVVDTAGAETSRASARFAEVITSFTSVRLLVLHRDAGRTGAGAYVIGFV